MKKKQKLIQTGLLAAALAAATLGQSRLDAQAPTIINQPTNRAVWAGGTVTFGVTISGGGPFSYQWRLNGTNLPNNIITTVAGGGVGDNGPATNASLGYPDGVAVDASGNLFIADRNNRRIRKVSTNNIITTVAGGGTNSLTDGVVGIDAEINFPYSVTVDGSGNLYFGQALFNLGISHPSIAKLSSAGVLTTEAGYGSVFQSYVNPWPWALAVDNSGNVFFASFEQVWTIDTNGDLFVVAGGGPDAPADGEVATNASLDRPVSLAVDRFGNLFVASANCIYKINASGILTTVAGNDTGGYSGDGGAATNAALSTPEGLAVDSFGNVFFADTGNNRIRKVDTNGIISTVAGNGTTNYSGDGGPATNASLNFPSSVAVDSAGNLFIADWQNFCIRKVTPGGIITTVAGTGWYSFGGDGGPATSAELSEPSGIAVDASGELLIADTDNSRVRKVGLNGIIKTVAGDGMANYFGDAAAIYPGMGTPFSVATDVSGNLFIEDNGTNSRVFKVGANGILTTAAGDGISGFSGDGGTATNAELTVAFGVAVDTNGNLFIADFGNSRVRKVDTNGIITTVAGIGQSGYTGDGGPATKARLDGPVAVAADDFGNLFVADAGARVRKVSANGIITTVAGNGTYTNSGDGGVATNAGLGNLSGIAADAFGNLFIAETYGKTETISAIRKVDADGIITTFAGNGTEGFSGDGGPATNAALLTASGIAADAFGNVFIADSDNARIRKVTNTQGPTLRLDNVSPGDSGNYDVVVTGPSGKTISRVASLLVAASPVAYESDLQPPGSVTMYFLARPDSANVLLSTASLTPPVTWQPLSTNLAGTDGAWQYTDTNTAASAARFFRSVMINSQ